MIGNTQVFKYRYNQNYTYRHQEYSSKNISEGCIVLANTKSKLAHLKCEVLVKTDDFEQKIIFEQYRLTPHSKLHNALYMNLLLPT